MTTRKLEKKRRKTRILWHFIVCTALTSFNVVLLWTTVAWREASDRESITETEVHCNAYPALAVSICSHPMRALCIAVAPAERKSNGSLVSAWINCCTVLRMSNINSVQYPARRRGRPLMCRNLRYSRMAAEKKTAAIRLLLYASQDLIVHIYDSGVQASV